MLGILKNEKTITGRQLQLIIDQWRDVLERDRKDLERRFNEDSEVDGGNEERFGDVNDKENVDINRRCARVSGDRDVYKVETRKDGRDYISNGDGNSAAAESLSVSPLTSPNDDNRSKQFETSRRRRADEIPVDGDTGGVLKDRLTPIVDSRDLEKERLSGLCEKSVLKIGDSDRNHRSKAAFGHKIKNSTRWKNEGEYFPKGGNNLISDRQKEIDRLAELFENSPSSRCRTEGELATEAPAALRPGDGNDTRLPWRSSSVTPTNHHHVSPKHLAIGPRYSIPADASNEHVKVSGRVDEAATREFGGNIDRDSAPAGPPMVNVMGATRAVHSTPSGPPSRRDDAFGLPAGCGDGDGDNRRTLIIEQREKEYRDYMRQARLQMRNTRSVIHNNSNQVSLMDTATQTDFSNLNFSNPEANWQRPSFFQENKDGFLSLGNFNGDNKTNKGTCTSGPASPTHLERSNSQSPIRSPRGRDMHRGINYLPGSPYLLPTTPTGDKGTTESFVDVSVSNTHMKQYIYREELKKQIEERQRLEAERKEREKREEELMEKRVREQQEKLRMQYEMEERQRMEYALRRHIQDDELRQRLTEMDKRVMQCNYNNYSKQHVPITSSCSTATAPPISPDDRPLPLPDKKDKLQQKNNTNTLMMTSTINDNGYSNAAKTSNDANSTSGEQGAIVLSKQPSKPINLNRSDIQKSINKNNSDSNKRNIDPLIGVDLLANNNLVNDTQYDKLFSSLIIEDNCNDDVNDDCGDLNNVKEQVCDDCTVNDKNLLNNRSTSPAVPAVRTRARLDSKLQLIEDKWQVPVVEKTYIRPTALYNHRPQRMPLNLINDSNSCSGRSSYNNNNNNDDGYYSSTFNTKGTDNVLTQLGSFRRQLQLEHMKLQERLYNQKMGTTRTNQLSPHENIKAKVSETVYKI